MNDRKVNRSADVTGITIAGAFMALVAASVVDKIAGTKYLSLENVAPNPKARTLGF